MMDVLILLRFFSSKAMEEAVRCGLELPEAIDLISELRELLEQIR
jgi:hypothetical protein